MTLGDRNRVVTGIWVHQQLVTGKGLIGQDCGCVLAERREWSPVAALGARSAV